MSNNLEKSGFEIGDDSPMPRTVVYRCDRLGLSFRRNGYCSAQETWANQGALQKMTGNSWYLKGYISHQA